MTDYTIGEFALATIAWCTLSTMMNGELMLSLFGIEAKPTNDRNELRMVSYPNGFEDGKPADYYTEADSRQAIGCVGRTHAHALSAGIATHRRARSDAPGRRSSGLGTLAALAAAGGPVTITHPDVTRYKWFERRRIPLGWLDLHTTCAEQV